MRLVQSPDLGEPIAIPDLLDGSRSDGAQPLAMARVAAEGNAAVISNMHFAADVAA